MTTLILTHGPTHSGKTTFSKNFISKLDASTKFIHIDNDEFDEFIKSHFLNLRNDPEVLARRSPTDPDLRLLMPQLVAKYALREGYSVIASAAHLRRTTRESYYKIARGLGAKIILIIFDLEEDEIEHRIDVNRRDNNILDISPHGGKTFQDLHANQKSIIEKPNETELNACFKVIRVNNHNSNSALDQLLSLVQ